MVANPARGQLNRESEYFPVRVRAENLVSRDGFGSPVPRQPVHPHTQAESGAYLRDSSRVPRRRPYSYLNRHTLCGITRDTCCSLIALIALIVYNSTVKAGEGRYKGYSTVQYSTGKAKGLG